MSDPEPDAQPQAGIEDLIQIGAAAGALGVSVDTLRRWERSGRIAFERRGNRRYLSAVELSRLLHDRASHSQSSARNQLAGVVVAVKRDTVMAQIDMVCGPFRVVSLMSREAADDLGLRPGVSASAVIKATNVVVERR
jgi:molybdopterin-binding protein